MRTLLDYFWTFVGLVFVAVTVLTIYDWVCDNLDVVRMAEQEACADEADGCRAKVTLLMRTPITQSFELATGRRPRVHVRCTRACVLLGDYKCTALEPEPGALPPAPASSVHAAPPPGSAGRQRR
jgi:hypothetical protein